MRILAVTNMYPTAQSPGLGIFVEQQIKSLRQIGLAVDVLFLDRVQDGMTVYLSLIKQLQAKVKHFRPDLVHVMYGGVMAEIVTRTIHDRPIVITFHGTDLLGEYFAKFPRRLLARYGVWASYRAAQRASGIVIVFKGLRFALPEHFNKPIRVIPCGIDLDRFKFLNRDECRSSLGWNSNGFHILFPSNSGNPVKRPDLAVSAVEAANRLGIQAELHYLRGIPNREVPGWINASDALILTSYHEASPTIVKEALACNVPVVSVNVGDVYEQIRGVDGCYLAEPNASDLAAKLFKVYTGPRRIGARDKMKDLSLECIALRLQDFYSEILAVFRPTDSTVAGGASVTYPVDV